MKTTILSLAALATVVGLPGVGAANVDRNSSHGATAGWWGSPDGCVETATTVGFGEGQYSSHGEPTRYRQVYVAQAKFDYCSGAILSYVYGEYQDPDVRGDHLGASFDGYDQVTGAAVALTVDLTWTPDADTCVTTMALDTRPDVHYRDLETSCEATVSGSLLVGGEPVALDGATAYTSSGDLRQHATP